MIEFFASILMFIVALPYFWLIFLGLAVLTSVFVIKEDGLYTSLSTIILIVLFFAKWEAISLNPLYAAGGALAYLAMGLLWSRYQWARLLSKKFDYFVSLQNNFLKKFNLGLDHLKKADLSHAELNQYVEYVTTTVVKTNIDYSGPVTSLKQFHATLAPKASHSKGSIVMWITYWPVSSVWYIVKDIVADLHRALYRMVAGRFQRMATEKFEQL
jgi:hypothetical protein